MTQSGNTGSTSGGGNGDSGHDQIPIGPDPAPVDQRLIAPPTRPIGTAWAATYPTDPLKPHGAGPRGGGSRNASPPWSRGPSSNIPDPGTPKRALIAWIVFAVSLLAVAVSQQLGAAAAEEAAAPDASVAPAARIVPPPMDDPFDITARLFVKLAHAGMSVTDSDRTTMQGQIVGAARNPADKFRAAVVVAEALGREEQAEAQLAKLEEADAARIAKRAKASQAAAANAEKARAQEAADNAPERTLLTGADIDAITRIGPTLAELELDLDIALARRVWAQGAESLTTDEAQRLTTRHGWYGTLLTTHGQPFSQGPRADIVANAKWIMVLMLGAVGVLGIAILGGITAAIIMGFLISNGRIKIHFQRPIPGGSVYLETAAVFVLGFLLFKLLLGPLLVLLLGVDSPILTGAMLAGQWLLLPIIFWPRLRGVSWKQWREDVGIAPIPGRSVIREIGAGIFGYFAALPVLGLAMGITILIVLTKAMLAADGTDGMGGGPTPPSNPIAEMISQAPLWQLVMLFALATVWAPLVEECIFRGCLFRHMRSRMGVVLAALLSAGAFAFMHGYAVLLLLPVFTIGVIFGFMREWRGSIISAITAHALHNGTVLTLVGALFMILRG